MYSALTKSAKSIGERAKSIGKSVKNHAGIIKRKVAKFVYVDSYNPDPDPSSYVVQTLNEMIDSVKKSENNSNIYRNANLVLKGIFRCFNGFNYDSIPELNAIVSSHDQKKGIIRPNHLGDILEHFFGYNYLERHDSESVGQDSLENVVQTRRRIVEILLKNAHFETFCK